MKILITILFALLLTPTAHASTYFFMDGKGYNEQSQQVAFRFMDGNCYDLQSNWLAYCSSPVAVPQFAISPIASQPVVAPLENPVPKVTPPDGFTRCIDEPIKADYSTKMICYYNFVDPVGGAVISFPKVDVMFLQQHINGSGITITARTGQSLIVDNQNNEVR